MVSGDGQGQCNGQKCVFDSSSIILFDYQFIPLLLARLPHISNHKCCGNNKSYKMKDKKVLLSTLWIFVTLNYLYCDLIGLMDSNLLNQFLTGTVEGMDIDAGFLFGAGILMEIPIAMVLLSRILKRQANRFANIIAGFVKTTVMIITLFIGTPTIYYLFFATIEITTTLFIIWYAGKWTENDT